MRLSLTLVLTLMMLPGGSVYAASESSVQVAQAKKKKKKRKKKKRKKKKKKAAKAKQEVEAEAQPEAQPAESAVEKDQASKPEKAAPKAAPEAAPKAAPAAAKKALESPAAGGVGGWWGSRSSLGKNLLLGGVGGLVGGIGLSALGMSVANGAIVERETLMGQQTLTDDERTRIGSLQDTTNTMTVVHYLGFGVAGVSVLAALAGGFI